VALVIVDAENVRRSTWPNLSPADLVARARAWARHEGHGLLVVFDGRAPEEAEDVAAAPNADDEIVRVAREAGEPVWVATSDRGLRDRLDGYAQRLIGGGRFLAELEAA
jgi:hypothetical protein